MLKTLNNKIKRYGFSGLLTRARNKVIPVKCKSFSVAENIFNDKIGFEIGGYSPVFARRGILPIYPLAKRIDNCNYSNSTVWEGEIKAGKNFEFDRDKEAGYQYCTEAWNLSEVSTGKYDFSISSHMIEHTANPIRTLAEWIRILKDTGMMVIIFPHKNGSFDRLRPVTTLDHLIQDFTDDIGEDDLTHLPEILELHDLELDPGGGSYENFVARSQKNVDNRCLHHHVFDPDLAVKLIDYMGLQIHSVEVVTDFHIIVIAQKIHAGDESNNRKICKEVAAKSAHQDFFVSVD